MGGMQLHPVEPRIARAAAGGGERLHEQADVARGGLDGNDARLRVGRGRRAQDARARGIELGSGAAVHDLRHDTAGTEALHQLAVFGHERVVVDSQHARVRLLVGRHVRVPQDDGARPAGRQLLADRRQLRREVPVIGSQPLVGCRPYQTVPRLQAPDAHLLEQRAHNASRLSYNPSSADRCNDSSSSSRKAMCLRKGRIHVPQPLARLLRDLLRKTVECTAIRHLVPRCCDHGIP